jgi:lysophospholipase L1-like esterase
MKKFFFIFLIFVSFICIGFVLVACAVTRIMPLGDSITDGVAESTDDTGYRRSLYLQLTDEGYNIDFVGSLSGGIPNDFDKNHEGHRGWKAIGGQEGGIAPNVYNWLDTNPADIVLLHIGTNDVSSGDEDASEVEAILNNIDQWESDNSALVTVIMARITLRNDPLNPETIAFNDAVETMALDRIDIGDDIVIVDIENALTYPDDLADTVHPDNNGYDKMADVWFSTLQQILPDPLTDEGDGPGGGGGGCFISTASNCLRLTK